MEEEKVDEFFDIELDVKEQSDRAANGDIKSTVNGEVKTVHDTELGMVQNGRINEAYLSDRL